MDPIVAELDSMYSEVTADAKTQGLLKLTDFVEKQVTETTAEAVKKIAKLIQRVDIAALASGSAPQPSKPKEEPASSLYTEERSRRPAEEERRAQSVRRSRHHPEEESRPERPAPEEAPQPITYSDETKKHVQILANLVWHSKAFKVLTPEQRDHIRQARAKLETNVFAQLAIWVQHLVCKLRDTISGTRGLQKEAHREVFASLIKAEKGIREVRETRWLQGHPTSSLLIETKFLSVMRRFFQTSVEVKQEFERAKITPPSGNQVVPFIFEAPTQGVHAIIPHFKGIVREFLGPQPKKSADKKPSEKPEGEEVAAASAAPAELSMEESRSFVPPPPSDGEEGSGFPVTSSYAPRRNPSQGQAPSFYPASRPGYSGEPREDESYHPSQPWNPRSGPVFYTGESGEEQGHHPIQQRPYRS
jgi:hypothetical protein